MVFEMLTVLNFFKINTVASCFVLSGPLLQGELQVPAPPSPSKNPARDQWQEQSDPAEEYGHAGPADAARQCNDARHTATPYGERTHTYEHTRAAVHGEATNI